VKGSNTFGQRYATQAATNRAAADTASLTVERYFTVTAEGNGESFNIQSNTPSAGNKIVRKIWYKDEAFEDTDVDTWTLLHTFADDATYASTATKWQEYLDGQANGTPPFTLAISWEDIPALTGILDGYTADLVGAYGVAWLNPSYTGSAIRVRRASDNTEQDIGFDDQDLDTTALTTFCTGTNCFIRTWYDQSGGANHATQTTTAIQPKIYDSSTGVILTNSIAAIRGDGTTTKLANFSIALTGNYFIAVISKLDAIGTNMFLGTTGAGGYLRANDVGTLFDIRHDGQTGGATFTATAGTSQRLHVAQRVGTTMNYAMNGSNNTATELATQGATFTISCLLDGYQNQYEIDGTIQAVIIYNANKSADRTAIESALNDYFDIY